MSRPPDRLYFLKRSLPEVLTFPLYRGILYVKTVKEHVA